MTRFPAWLSVVAALCLVGCGGSEPAPEGDDDTLTVALVIPATGHAFWDAVIAGANDVADDPESAAFQLQTNRAATVEAQIAQINELI